MGLFTWISVGIVAGCLARDYMEGTGLDLLADVLIGIMGALTGGLAAVAVYGNPTVLMAASVNSMPRNSRPLPIRPCTMSQTLAGT